MSQSVLAIKTASGQNVSLCRVKEGDRMGSKTEKGSSTSISYISKAHSAVVSLKCLSFQHPAKPHE